MKLQLNKALWLAGSIWLLSWPVLSQQWQPQQKPVLAPDDIQLTIRNIADELQHRYVDPVAGQLAAEKLISTWRAGGFDRQDDVAFLHHQITNLLWQSTGDSGIGLLPRQPAIPLADDQSALNSLAKQHDSIKVEILPHNIGYLQISGNFNFPNRQALLTEQFRFLAGVDALIIDLRLADAADIAVAQQMLSYFVPPGTKLANVKFNQHSQLLTASPSEGFEPFKQDFPLYIVHSSFVAGSWEFFSYTLSQFDKAVIIGETTMGVNQLSQVVNVSDTLAMTMTYAVITQPTSHESWENDGVVPDYFFSAKTALQKAHQLALSKVTEK